MKHFFKQLIADAQPKADGIVNKTKQVTTRIMESKAVQASGRAAYNATVNTVGVATVLLTPAAKKVAAMVTKMTKDDKK